MACIVVHKSKSTLLALFTGGIGGHHFYLGNVVQGVLYLFFCWTLVPVLLSMIDIIRYIATPDHDWYLKHSKTVHINRTIG